MELALELVPLPVVDVDRAKAFYVAQVGFREDHDVSPAPGVRVVQLTPPGSACSVGLGTGLAAYEGEPGSLRALHLVVADVRAVRAGLLARGVPVDEVQDVGGGVLMASFADPDGNGWVLQELPWRRG